MRELNEKIARWAGFECKEKSTIGMFTGHWHYTAPDGSSLLDIAMPKFTESLDACFKWVVPKLYPLGKQVLLVSLSETRNHVKIVDAFAREEIVDAIAETPALALCLAVEKLIDSEATK